MTPLPMNVSATATPVARLNSRSAGAAPARTTPLPASATGLIALRMRSAALSSSRAPGSGMTGRRRGSGSASTSAAMTSSGSSMCVAPGFSDSATLNALRTTSGMISGLWSRVFHFVSGRMTLDDVEVLVRLLVHPLEVGLPGEGDERGAVEEGVGHRGDEVGRARPERAEAHAGAPRQAAVHVGHETLRPARGVRG